MLTQSTVDSFRSFTSANPALFGSRRRRLANTRKLILILGPPALIAGSYLFAFPRSNRESIEFAARVAEAETRTAKARRNEHIVLSEACAQSERVLQARLPADCRTIVRVPFVMAGDLETCDLERVYEQAVLPVSRALWRCYFDRVPDQPVIIVLLKNEISYRAVANSLDGYEPLAYSGYTQRSERRVVLNACSGEGTLAHELCHLLALFDFPEMPEWFDEGLAALHEEAGFSDDGLVMTGSSNWRNRLLADAFQSGEFPTLQSLIRTQSFRGEGENLNYAFVRSFCLYLQERGLLAHFYRKFRMAARNDPSGLNTLCELFGVDDSAVIDGDFRHWIETQCRSGSSAN